MSLLLLPESPGLATHHQDKAGLKAWLLFAPVLLWLALFVLVPTLNLVFTSFCGRDALGRVAYEFSWHNYVRAFSPVFFKVLLGSLCYALLTTVICLLIAHPAAYFIARSPPRRRYLL